jgi:hypothetical protein
VFVPTYRHDRAFSFCPNIQSAGPATRRPKEDAILVISFLTRPQGCHHSPDRATGVTEGLPTRLPRRRVLSRRGLFVFARVLTPHLSFAPKAD